MDMEVWKNEILEAVINLAVAVDKLNIVVKENTNTMAYQQGEIERLNKIIRNIKTI